MARLTLITGASSGPVTVQRNDFAVNDCFNQQLGKHRVDYIRFHRHC